MGQKKAILLSETGVKLPSDLSGLSHIRHEADVETSCEKVVRDLKKGFAKKSRVEEDAIPIQIDAKIIKEILSEPTPKGWHQRSLYLGIEGAYNWLAISNEATNFTPKDLDQVRSIILNSVRERTVSSFISLGPGNGEADKEIIIAIDNDDLKYYPIDISDGLLAHTALSLNQFATIPFGLVTDFEERFPFIRKKLSGVERPALVGMLGNTLCNLDRYETTLLRQMERFMVKGDMLLLDITIAKPGWKIDEKVFGTKHHSQSRIRFFSKGLSRQLGIPYEEILKNYHQRISYKSCRSDVPGTVGVDYYDSISMTRIQSFRWYDWEKLLAWLKAEFNFDVQYSKTCMYENQNRGEGVILLIKQ